MEPISVKAKIIFKFLFISIKCTYMYIGTRITNYKNMFNKILKRLLIYYYFVYLHFVKFYINSIIMYK